MGHAFPGKLDRLVAGAGYAAGMGILQQIPSDLTVSPEETDILLELSYLVTAVDGRLADEEIAAFGEVAGRLLGKPSITSTEVDALLARYAEHIDPAEIEARMRTIAVKLPERLHELAYKLALSFGLVDYDPDAHEDRLHAALGDALRIGQDRRAALGREVGLGGGLPA